MLLVPAYPLYRFMRKPRYRHILYSYIFRRHGSSVFPKYSAQDEAGQPRDDFEVSVFDLKIKSDEKLGAGAFAVVYKGSLKADCVAARRFMAMVRGEALSGEGDDEPEEANGCEEKAGENTKKLAAGEEGEVLDVAVKAPHNLSDERAA